MSSCCSACCAYLWGFNLKVSNYLILTCGAVMTFVGLKIAQERNLLSLLVLGLGLSTMLVAGLGLWLADNHGSNRPCCSRVYSALLLLLIVPQLVGAVLVSQPSFIDSMVYEECESFDKRSWANSKDCMESPEKCCDEKCRSCQEDVQRSRDFVASHATVCAYLFLGFGTVELLAWTSIQLLSYFGSADDIILEDFDTEPGKTGSRPQNRLLEAMKSKYRSHMQPANPFDDPLVGNRLLDDDDTELVTI